VNYFDHAMQVLAVQLDGLTVDPDLLRLYTLLLLVTGHNTTREDVHNAWAAWRAMTRPDHPALIPFAELSPEVAALDEPYARAIRLAAEALAASR
jgi:hypothetical protein